MDKTCLCLCNCSSFAVGKQGLWLASGDQLLHLSFELQTNLIVRLPKDPATPITTLDIGTAHLWIGTAGDGLIEFNKATEKCRRLTVKDGLLADAISCTHLSKDTLWIGYGTQDGGGIGFLNLGSRQCISFTPSLKEGTQAFTVTGGNTYFEPVNQPPRRPVTAIAPGKAGDIWFLTNAGALRCFRSRQNIWDGVPRVTAGSCLMVRAGRLAVGESHEAFGRTTTGPLGLDTLDLSTGRWQRFKSVPGLPSETVSALAPDGDNLWVGGMGYIALVDAAHDQVLNFTYVRARSVDKIQIGGGYVWAEYAGALHRASLQNLR